MIEQEIESTLKTWTSFIAMLLILGLILCGLAYGIANADETRDNLDWMESQICTIEIDGMFVLDAKCIEKLRSGK